MVIPTISITPVVWVNYNSSLTWIKATNFLRSLPTPRWRQGRTGTWIKAIWGWFPLLGHDFQWGRSEVVIIYPELWTHNKELMIYLCFWNTTPHSDIKKSISSALIGICNILKAFVYMSFLSQTAQFSCRLLARIDPADFRGYRTSSRQFKVLALHVPRTSLIWSKHIP